MSKYLKFEEVKLKTKNVKTKRFEVQNKKGEGLGAIMWNPGWRKYCFLSCNCFDYFWYDSICLTEIIIFLDKLNKEHKSRIK
ncbi:hypothetical protein ES708_19499 [subsurface metagenome]